MVLQRMSQFSVSYHLKSNDAGECVDLLKSSGIKGYVFPAVNGWVSFVCKEEDLDKNVKLIKANTGLLLYYYFAEDFGWGFRIVRDCKTACRYDCRWGGPVFDEYGEIQTDEEGYLLEVNEVKIDDKDFNISELSMLLDNDINKIKKMKKLLYPANIMEAIEGYPSFKFAEMLGIENVDGISFDYVSRSEQDYAGLIKV